MQQQNVDSKDAVTSQPERRDSILSGLSASDIGDIADLSNEIIANTNVGHTVISAAENCSDECHCNFCDICFNCFCSCSDDD